MISPPTPAGGSPPASAAGSSVSAPPHTLLADLDARGDSAAVNALQARGYTAVVVTANTGRSECWPSPTSYAPKPPAAVSAARRLTRAAPVLLTGDNQATADQLAAQVGITDVRAGLLP